MVLDRYDDDDLFLRKAFSEKGVPALVKAASDVRDMRNKSSEDFALVLERGHQKNYKYPIFDAGNTIASAVYFNEFGDQLEDSLKKTASIKIKGALEAFGFAVPDSLTKTASIELGYSDEADERGLEALFGFEPGESEIVRDAFAKCSPRGKQRLIFQVKEASEKAAEGFDAYGTTTLGSDLEFALDARKVLLHDDTKKEDLDMIMVKSSSVSPEALVSDIAQFDLENQLIHHYGKFIPDPFESVYGSLIEKQAAEPTVEINGDLVAGDSLAKMIDLGYSNIEDSFGASFAEQLKSDPVPVFNSLPTPHKKALGNIFKG